MADVLEGVVGTLGTSNADLLDAVGSSTTETIIGMSFANVNSSSQDVTIVGKKCAARARVKRETIRL